jgi:homoserine O-acetyltransferase
MQHYLKFVSVRYLKFFGLILLTLLTAHSMAQTTHTPKQATWVAKEFKFHTGEVLSEVKLGYTTLGDPTGIPVLILHGTAGTGLGMLNPAFGGQLFGPGQALDANKYFIILPDAIGMGASSKPSDGLRAKFPKYNYDDMVSGQYRLVTEGLGLKHLHLVLGNSMGGMQTWLWGITHPTFMDALVPMASMPAAMSGRNWLTRRLIIDSIRNDPAWQNGNYTQQPPSLQFASVFFQISTSGGNMGLQKLAPSRELADQLLDKRLKAAFKADANDNLYQWDSSRDYDPSRGLEKIQARVLVINSADDERNPPEFGVIEAALKRIPKSQLLLIPASPDTSGHGTTGQAKWWNKQLAEFLKTVPVHKQ